MDAKKINIILDDFEATNPKLYYHSERVAMICYAFAQEVNLSHQEREIAYFSGMLHDIGKFYLGEVDETDSDDFHNIVGGSIVYFDKEFSKIIPVISSRKQLREEDSERYDYNVNLIKLILNLSNDYDELRMNGKSHEKACEKLRKDNHSVNNMVTVLLKAIIKNKLNYEY